MRKVGRSIVLGFVGMALAVFSLATPAAAVGFQTAAATSNASIDATAGLKVGQPVIHKRGDGVTPPAWMGDPSEWGVVKLDVNAPTGSVPSLKDGCQNVSHGIWCYGWEKVSPGKRCFSNYSADVKHKSTVRVMNVDHGSGWVGIGEIAYANGYSGLQYTCYSYYANA